MRNYVPGALYVVMHFFFAYWPAFLCCPRVFSRALGCGARRGPANTNGASRVPAVLRGACSGSSKSRELVNNHGIAFRRARANQTHGNPQAVFLFLVCFAFCCCVELSATSTKPALKTLYTLTQPRYNSSRAICFSLCDSHERCFCLCVCVPSKGHSKQ